MMIKHLLTTALTVSIHFFVAESFSCKDQSNKDIDWFTAYKLPPLNENNINGESDGTGFFYLDANVRVFTPSTAPITENEQAIAYTLQQMYDRQADSDVFHVIYNDEPSVELDALSAHAHGSFDSSLFRNETANDAATKYGHTKGVVFFDGNTGVWLVHSVPKFPPAGRYSYPHSGTVYGQNFLCMTFNYTQLNSIGTQLYFNHPKIYSSALPTVMAAENADLARVIGREHKTGLPTSSIITLSTINGHSFKSFAKTGDFGLDLYDGLVAKELRVGLNVESWRRGYAVTLDCQSQFPVLDSQFIQVGDTIEFKYTQDHAKYAVSVDPLSPYICLGDINRMTSQFTRGGGTVCFRDSFVWQTFSKFTVSTNSC